MGKLAYAVVVIGYIPLNIQMIFFRGQKGPNKFGEEPSKEKGQFLKQVFNFPTKTKDNQPVITPIN